MGKKREKKLFSGLALLNPKNLAREVHVYGYDFNWKSHVLLLIASLSGISVIGLVFRLKPVYFTVATSAVLAVLPVLVLNSFKRMYEQKRFADALTYMEQMLYSFQKSGKVLTALSETEELFDEGQMKTLIGQAAAYLNKGKACTEKGVLREALEIIERPYECVKLKTVHELLISCEQYGGDSGESVTLILADLELYKRRGYRLQAQKKKSHTDNVISIAVATVLCAVALYVLDAMQKMFPGAAPDVSIFAVPLIQVTSLLFLLFMLYVFVKSQKSLTADWLQVEGMHQADYLLDSYDMVVNYDEAKEKRKSIILAAPCLIGAAAAFLFTKTAAGVILLVLGAFLLMQHRTGYHLAKKDVNQELYIALPQWLVEIALLLQNNNVQVAIAKSIDGAPPVLQRELEQLMARLEKAPDSLRSYTDFCSGFDIPEAQSCMKILHAISESGTGNAGVQINNLLARVNEMQDIADDIRNEGLAFKAELIFMYPIGGATVKMLVDLSIGMVFLFGMLGNMGGM